MLPHQEATEETEPVSVNLRPGMELKSQREIEKMRSAGRIVAEVLRVLKAAVHAGATTKELDSLAAVEIKKRGAVPAFLNYCGYPAVICASINEEVVHGIPASDRVLKAGDIVSIDLGVKLDGYYGDAAFTAAVGTVSPQAAALMAVTEESLRRAVAAVKPGGFLGDISQAVQYWAEKNGMSVVRDFVGHGIGRRLHEDPAVPNYGKAGTGMRLEPGLVIAIEPMINAGGCGVKVCKNGWTVVTEDKSLSAHFEHTVAVTEKGCEVLTL